MMDSDHPLPHLHPDRSLANTRIPFTARHLAAPLASGVGASGVASLPPAASSSSSSPPPTSQPDSLTPKLSQKVRRVRTGCLTCRARKVKCDETPGACNNCKKRALVCDFTESSATSTSDGTWTTRPADPSLAPTPVPAGHRQSACQQCRKARSKCTQAVPRCGRCALKQLECVYSQVRAADVTGLTATARSRIDKARQRSRQNAQQQQQQQHLATPSQIPQARSHSFVVATGPLVEQRTPLPAPSVASEVSGARASASPAVVGRSEQQSAPPLSNSHFPTSQPPASEAPQPEMDRLPENVYPYLDAFFSYVAPYQTNTFLHRGTFMCQVRDGRASETLLLAICAITVRFINRPPASAAVISPQPPLSSTQANRWASLAIQQLMTGTPVMELHHAMAALVLCKHAAYSGDYNQAFLMAALANRFALKLRLFDETKWAEDKNSATELRWVDREQRRRVMFACYSVDRMTATGMRELTFCPAESIKLQLPCEDYNFEFDVPCVTPIPALESDEPYSSPCEFDFRPVGIMGQQVLLISTRYMILRYIENLASADSLPPWSPDSDYMLCLRKLGQWSTNIPPHLQLRRENLFGRQHTPQLGPLIMLHLWNDMLHCELYRLALQTHAAPHVQEMFFMAPPGWVEETRKLCVYHARAMAQKLAMVQSDLCAAEAAAAAAATTSPVNEGQQSHHQSISQSLYQHHRSQNESQSQSQNMHLRILDPSLAMMCFASVKVQLMGASSVSSSSPLVPGNPAAGMFDSEMREMCEVLFSFVERLEEYFPPARIILKEMKSLLHSKGLRGRWSDSRIPSNGGSQTQDHPWLARVQSLDQHSPKDVEAVQQNPGGGGGGGTNGGTAVFDDMLPELDFAYFYPFEMNIPSWLR